MLIGIMGQMGTGKSLGATALACALANATGQPLWANYHIRHPNFNFIASSKQLMAIEGGILVLDEAHLFLDSRQWKERSNISLTHWATKIRKKNLICFVISQHIRQIDLRLRNLLDILIVCEKIPTGFKLNFVDFQYRLMGRSVILDRPEKYFRFYDTFEEIKPLEEPARPAWINYKKKPR